MARLWELELGLFSEGLRDVCGVDEAGRGPLAGPVCAAAVLLPPGLPIPGLNDSKKLTQKKREALYEIIIENAVSFGVAFAEAWEIDRLNILNATYLAMNRAIEQLSPAPSLALIDGNRADGITWPSRCVVKGDQTCASIAAASILAKVRRDRTMEALASLYPQYAFRQHKGYPTALHYERLRQYGPCPVHRRSFRLEARPTDGADERTGERLCVKS